MADTQLASASEKHSADSELGEAGAFLRRFFSGTAKQRSRLAPKAPLAAIQIAALGHRDPFFRRGCLFFLDHYANDQSMAVFAQALHDPIDFVRNAALHGPAGGLARLQAQLGRDPLSVLLGAVHRPADLTI